ncbi:unnamed protein product [Arctogadus glacialis]
MRAEERRGDEKTTGVQGGGGEDWRRDLKKGGEKRRRETRGEEKRCLERRTHEQSRGGETWREERSKGKLHDWRAGKKIAKSEEKSRPETYGVASNTSLRNTAAQHINNSCSGGPSLVHVVHGSVPTEAGVSRPSSPQLGGQDILWRICGGFDAHCSPQQNQRPPSIQETVFE